MDGLATVAVNRLRQVADPERPRDHAFESPPAAPHSYLGPLRRGDEVFLVAGPLVVDGRQFWKIAVEDFGCCVPFGWVPVTTGSGDVAIAASEIVCPDTSETFIALTFAEVSRLGAMSCFGSADVRVRGILTCSEPSVDAAYWLSGASWLEDLHHPRDCSLGASRVYGEPVTSLLDAPESGSYFTELVELTGHFNDAASTGCFWSPGNYMMIDVEGAPIETAEFACRTRFVVTAVRPV